MYDLIQFIHAFDFVIAVTVVNGILIQFLNIIFSVHYSVVDCTSIDFTSKKNFSLKIKWIPSAFCASSEKFLSYCLLLMTRLSLE